VADQDTPTTQQRAARTALRSAVTAASRADARRDDAIRAAFAANVPLGAMLQDTGLSKSRLYQIRAATPRTETREGTARA
jgi:crotonobetainyl-CoA:carnitine CoA-transferase CaiB-like acyl-CoA transferase